MARASGFVARRALRERPRPSGRPDLPGPVPARTAEYSAKKSDFLHIKWLSSRQRLR